MECFFLFSFFFFTSFHDMEKGCRVSLHKSQKSKISILPLLSLFPPFSFPFFAKLLRGPADLTLGAASEQRNQPHSSPPLPLFPIFFPPLCTMWGLRLIGPFPKSEYHEPFFFPFPLPLSPVPDKRHAYLSLPLEWILASNLSPPPPSPLSFFFFPPSV